MAGEAREGEHVWVVAISGGMGLFHEDAKPRDESIQNGLQNPG